jgi:hypothetical protein
MLRQWRDHRDAEIGDQYLKQTSRRRWNRMRITGFGKKKSLPAQQSSPF